MRLHRRLADAELVGDLLVLVAVHHERQHAPLLRREQGGALGEGIAGGHFRRNQDLAVEYRADDGLDLLQRGRLVDIGRGTEVVGAAGDGRVARRRDDDDRHGRPVGAQQGKAGEPVHARHVEVEQQRVGLRLQVERGFDLGERAGERDRRTGEGARQRRLQGIAHHRMVIRDQEGARCRRIGHLESLSSRPRCTQSLLRCAKSTAYDLSRRDH